MIEIYDDGGFAEYVRENFVGITPPQTGDGETGEHGGGHGPGLGGGVSVAAGTLVMLGGAIENSAAESAKVKSNTGFMMCS